MKVIISCWLIFECKRSFTAQKEKTLTCQAPQMAISRIIMMKSLVIVAESVFVAVTSVDMGG